MEGVLTRRYLVRITSVILILAAGAGLLLWWRPGHAGSERWRFFRLGEASGTTLAVSSPLLFLRGGGSTDDLDGVMRLAGGLAFLPKKAGPLFGQRSATPDAVADVVLEPGKCLLIHRLRFVQAAAADGTGGGRVLLSVSEASRLTSSGSTLRGALPPRCGTGDAPDCRVLIWAEARPKKCD